MLPNTECDICFTYKSKYVDICFEYGGTWVVRYDNSPIGKGHDMAGTGFASRLDAFNWAKEFLGFHNKWDDVIKDDY